MLFSIPKSLKKKGIENKLHVASTSGPRSESKRCKMRSLKDPKDLKIYKMEVQNNCCIRFHQIWMLVKIMYQMYYLDPKALNPDPYPKILVIKKVGSKTVYSRTLIDSGSWQK